MVPGMVSDGVLDYLPQYKVVRCVTCRYAVPPSALSRHMKDLHHIYRGERRSLLEYAANLDLAEPVDIVTPEPHEPPVPSIPVEDGVACNSEYCKYMSVTTKRMKRHWVTHHQEKGSEGTGWRSVKLQTFFRGNNLRYFIVTPVTKGYQVVGRTQCTLGPMSVNSPIHLWDPSSLRINALGLKTKDLEIFHHYTISTCIGLAHRGEDASVWRTSIPQLAQGSHYVMDMILSISALHLAHLRPARRQLCVATAAQYQHSALQGFQSSVSKVDEGNCLAVFAFCRMMMVHALAHAGENESDAEGPGADHPTETQPDVVPQWLKLQRGAFNMLKPYGRMIFALPNTPFKPMLHCFETVQIDCALNPWDDQLLSLFSLFSDETLFFFPSPATEHLANDVCANALRTLRQAFALPHVTAHTIQFRDTVACWPLYQPPNFFDLLQAEHPKALIVLAFYSVLITNTEDYWYLKGHGKRMLADIRGRLDSGWERWIEWPLQQLGFKDLSRVQGDFTYCHPSDTGVNKNC